MYRLPLVSILCLFIVSCASVSINTRPLPPVLAQEQMDRSYVKVGLLEVSRERFGVVEGLTTADYEWAYLSLREEAHKVDADAVILPEVRMNVSSFLLFPFSEITAKALAVRFR